jgi:hypothetical protein
MKLFTFKVLHRITTPLGWLFAFLVVLANVVLWLIYLSPFIIVTYAIVKSA